MTMTDARTSAWVRFWDRGGWWRAVLLAVVYLALYLGFQYLMTPLVGDLVDPDDALADPSTIFFGLALPIVFGAVVLIAFARSVHWLPRPLFGPQPVPGRWWMWFAPALVLVPIVFHLIGLDYSRYTAATVATALATGLAIGTAEELLTRGAAVTMLRRGGYGEWAVMTLSSLLFALLHTSNLLSGQSITVVAPTVVYTFGFGICMYLTLRVTGNLIWPILLHAFTDPTTFLASGGIDEGVAGTSNVFLTTATFATFALVAFAIVALVAVRGHAHGRADADEVPTHPAHVATEPPDVVDLTDPTRSAHATDATDATASTSDATASTSDRGGQRHA